MSVVKGARWGLKSKGKCRFFKALYGPVFSWRLGKSLGIDLISTPEKTCSFDCIYCQLGKTKNIVASRQKFISTSRVLDELKKLPKVEIDYLTFSGMGEPTLASNLGEVIKEIKKISRLPVAVLTNSSLISLRVVRQELSLADFVIAKLDAPEKNTFLEANRPSDEINFEGILQGLQNFREEYKGKFALQMMFSRFNLNKAETLALLACKINPNEVQLNTPLRPSPVQSLHKEQMEEIKKFFTGLRTISVFDVLKVPLEPLFLEETLKRRPVL
jgi:wyosine [tRNA(Phe)-imidazoG37] synthetase (radical SAM superfamily)